MDRFVTGTVSAIRAKVSRFSSRDNSRQAVPEVMIHRVVLKECRHRVSPGMLGRLTRVARYMLLVGILYVLVDTFRMFFVFSAPIV